MWTCWKAVYPLYTTWEDTEQGDIFGNWISKDVGITQTICVVTSFSVENMEFTNRKKISGPACLLFLVHLNPTFLSFHSMTWSLLCWRIYEALLNSFSLLSLSLLLNYLFHIFRALSVQHLLLSLLGLVYVPTSFCLFNMSNLQNKNAGVYKYKLFIPSSTMMIFFPRAGNRVTVIYSGIWTTFQFFFSKEGAEEREIESAEIFTNSKYFLN